MVAFAVLTLQGIFREPGYSLAEYTLVLLKLVAVKTHHMDLEAPCPLPGYVCFSELYTTVPPEMENITLIILTGESGLGWVVLVFFVLQPSGRLGQD